MEENAQWRLVHFPLLTHRREQWPPGTAAPARTSSSSKTVPGSRSYFPRGSLSSAFFFLSLTHSLSFSHSLSLSLSLDDSIPEELSEGRHTDLSRECIVSSHHLFPRIRKGEGLSLSLSLSFRASEAEDRGRVSFLKDAELEGVGYPFTD